MISSRPGVFWLLVASLAFVASRPAAAGEPPDRIDPALQQRIQGKASAEDVELDASWSRGGKVVTARVFGDGVGIWNDEREFHLSKPQLLELLRTIRTSRFGRMPDFFGEAEDEGNDKVRLKGALSVRAGSVSKSVQQLVDGEQSKQFARLVNSILDFCQAQAASGVGAESMLQGLQMLAAGRLSPRILDTSLYRPVDPKGGDKQSGWLLRTAGTRVTSQEFASGAAPGPLREIRLSDDEFRGLVATLVEGDPSAIPQSVYAPRYTDFSIQLFRFRRAIVGRQFLGMTAETHGERQKAFDRIAAAFEALHRRVVEEGTVVKAEPARDGGKARRTEKEAER